MANQTQAPKVITFNAIGEALAYNATTVRCWARKPIPNKVYDPNEINYDFINSQLMKIFSKEEIESKLGGWLGESLMIEKSVKNIGGTVIKLQAKDMKVGNTYLIISHVNRFHYTLKGITVIDEENVYIFQDERFGEFKKTQDAYRVLSESELASDRWTIRELNK